MLAELTQYTLGWTFIFSVVDEIPLNVVIFLSSPITACCLKHAGVFL